MVLAGSELHQAIETLKGKRVKENRDTLRVGVLSDTHGLLRPEIAAALHGVDHILHAGDVGDPAILQQLSAIAPLTAIRGNVDTHGPCATLPATDMLDLGGVTIYMVHSVHDLDIDPTRAGVRLVISGHTHQPDMQERNGVLYLNPGSAGPRRFRLPIAMSYLRIENGTLARDSIDHRQFDL